VLLYYGLAAKTTFRRWSGAVQVVRLRYGAMTEHNVIGTGWDGKKLVRGRVGFGSQSARRRVGMDAKDAGMGGIGLKFRPRAHLSSLSVPSIDSSGGSRRVCC